MGDEPPRPPPLRRRGRQGSALTLRIPWVAGLQGPVVGTGRLAVLRIRTAARIRGAPRPGAGPAGAVGAAGVPVPGRGELRGAAGVLPAVRVERGADSRSAAHGSPHDR